MSGLNPFRPRKPEDPAGHHLPSSQSTPSNSYFSVPSKAAVVDISSHPNGLPGPPPDFIPSNDDSLSSDGHSITDPFHQQSDLSEDDAEGPDEVCCPLSNPTVVSSFPSGDLPRHPQSGLPSTPPASTTITAPSAGQLARPNTHYHFLGQENQRISRDNGSVVSSDASVRSLTPHGGRTSNSSTTDMSQAPTHPGITTISVTGREVRPLASRSSNRIPPPPPKSHHGRLISTSSSTTPSRSHPAPSKSANRFSFHGSSSEASLSPTPSQVDAGHFNEMGGNPPEKSAEHLRRSQSQHKRPPTPPLARRHSQMRRSKTMLSKPNIARLSMPPMKVGSTTESPPPSPESWSFQQPRTREARLDAPSSEENAPRPPPYTQTSDSRSSTSATETSTSTSLSNPRAPLTKRVSQHNPMPPPPPPRRTRGSSNHSSEGTHSTSLRPEKRTDENDGFTPLPSNAKDILADLTRLQKEVDDLRGHYESRKVSQ
ncbi:hypothetical protein EYZ11_011881 [Aspergillus tanneri]|uniref:Uncharacterized protein n=1 Tax=Aspergillus tanneri TaxID=1220188 RepID=A0A4V3UMU6_9EURO|nr:uncharacterized protein ATNIH1004_006892 [Aspergillus tanneri]KAA8645473.1 hypothetical protein ATNIH1004_006892 [Aspergillus tanneri]THC88674.1 hypothetical protein EYZ11_011881 [Aspergillus tanneri]